MDAEVDKRGRILKAAAQMFVENGLQVPMSAIAEAAGVATGSIYTYFASKDELVLEIFKKIGAETDEAVLIDLDPSRPLKDRLMGYFLRYIDFIWTDPIRATLLEYLSNAPVIPLAEAMVIFRRLVDYGAALVSEGQEAGVMQGFPPHLANSFVRGAIRNTLKRMRGEGTRLTGTARHQIAEMCWAAIILVPGDQRSSGGRGAGGK